MPLRAKINETKLPKMSALETNGNGIHTNGAPPKTGIKVIIIGAGTLLSKLRSVWYLTSSVRLRWPYSSH